MEIDTIHIQGAREHNLKNVSLTLPKKKFIVFTGVSGSGKSSLAFDTLFAEGQRRYVESLSAYARQFLGQLEKPKVDHIRGLSPAIAIEQKAASNNPRSTVGTITEISDYLRVLWARAGMQYCPTCGKPVGAASPAEIVERLLDLPEGTKILVLAPVIENRKGEFRDVLHELRQQGFARVRDNGEILPLDNLEALDKRRKHSVEAVVDRAVIAAGAKAQLTDSVETALRRGRGNVWVLDTAPGGQMLKFSDQRMCCGRGFPELSPQVFSFNSPLGMCAACNGLGTRLEIDPGLVVGDPNLSVRGGAIIPWSSGMVRGEGWQFQIVQGIADEFGIDLDKPFNRLTKRHQDILLYGAGERRVTVQWEGRHGQGEWDARFEGVIPMLMRRYKQTDSEMARTFYQRFFSSKPCQECGSTRLREEARHVRFENMTITALSAKPITEAHAWLSSLKLRGNSATIAADLLREITARMRFLIDVGLGYLTLERSGPSLSGGEGQRIRLASQVGSELTGVIYILDEPSIGLHQRDNGRLLRSLQHLRDLGNTVIVVEHDRETMEAADWLVDFGPGAGVHGGEIVFSGPPASSHDCAASLTGKYLSGEFSIGVPRQRRSVSGRGEIVIRGAAEHNLKKIDVAVPLGCLVAITGVSGAGKSTLINGILYPALQRALHGTSVTPGQHAFIQGLEQLDKVIRIDQKPIGRTPRSNPSTYTKVFDLIRDVFAQTPEARAYGYAAGRFSFNVKGGRCEACQGDGFKTVEMHFLADVFVPCEVCKGRRFNDATLRVLFKGKNISDVLGMTVSEALEFFANHPRIVQVLRTLDDVGLGYMQLGQTSPTLSGGEAQRIKLSRELAKRDTGRTLYLLDEPTTGLHFEDIRKLISVLDRLTDAGNTVLVIEHNLDVIKVSDYLIELGPEGGGAGGYLVEAGTPEQLARSRRTHTGQYLRELLPGLGESKKVKSRAVLTA